VIHAIPKFIFIACAANHESIHCWAIQLVGPRFTARSYFRLNG